MSQYTGIKCGNCGGNVLESEEITLLLREKVLRCIQCNRQVHSNLIPLRCRVCGVGVLDVALRDHLGCHIDEAKAFSIEEVIRFFEEDDLEEESV